MSPIVIGFIIILFILASLWFATLSYALRDLSRARLADFLERRGRVKLLQPTLAHTSDLIFITALGRLVSNVAILIAFLRLFYYDGKSPLTQYALAIVATLMVTLFCAIVLPNALARYAGEQLIGFFAGVLQTLRWIMLPVTKLTHSVDDMVRELTGRERQIEPELIEQDILSVVEEGEKEGVVDQTERRMIEAVIRFGDTTVNQIMTARPEMIGINAGGTLAEIRDVLAESGHSRLPAYRDSLDKIIGVLYARDLLKFLDRPASEFNIEHTLRPAFFVPETKQLRNLLNDFRVRKVHIAIVLDEYGGTSGLVTIEDVLEELVGDISDEHEPAAPALLKQLSESSWEADGRAYLDEINRQTGLTLPEDAGYDTLGGYITTSLGHIPGAGEVFTSGAAKFTTLDAELQKINRVRIDLKKAPPINGAVDRTDRIQ